MLHEMNVIASFCTIRPNRVLLHYFARYNTTSPAFPNLFTCRFHTAPGQPLHAPCIALFLLTLFKYHGSTYTNFFHGPRIYSFPCVPFPKRQLNAECGISNKPMHFGYHSRGDKVRFLRPRLVGVRTIPFHLARNITDIFQLLSHLHHREP